jgi:amidase
LGHVVASEDPPYPLWATSAGIERWFTAAVADARPYLDGSGLEPRTRRHVRAGQVLLRLRPPGDGDRERLRATLTPFFDRHDVLVMPTLARPCPAARRWGEASWLRSVITSLTYAPMAGIWNLAGFPAAAVPIAPVAGGLPGSVQLVAAPGGESVILALAAQLERARGWPRHAPAYTHGEARSRPSAPA